MLLRGAISSFSNGDFSFRIKCIIRVCVLCGQKLWKNNNIFISARSDASKRSNENETAVFEHERFRDKSKIFDCPKQCTERIFYETTVNRILCSMHVYVCENEWSERQWNRVIHTAALVQIKSTEPVFEFSFFFTRTKIAKQYAWPYVIKTGIKKTKCVITIVEKVYDIGTKKKKNVLAYL